MARTALSIVQDAALKLGVKQPTALFGVTGRTETELREALIEAADKIVFAHDWAKLKTIATHTGDGTTTAFAEPTGYLRMPKDAQVWSTKWQEPLTKIEPERWLSLDVRAFDVVTGTWSLFGGNFNYKPALSSDETARFWYVSNTAVAPASGANKAQFTADDDTFRLDDRVLELTLVWLFRTQKGMDYAEDMQAAEMALSRAIERDKGARILAQPSRQSYDAKIAYPQAITP